MASSEVKAEQLVMEAKKKLSASKGFFSFLFGSTSKIEDAAECYQKAANLFKMAKKWTDAGNAFCEAAHLYLKTSSPHEAASKYVDAASCYKKANPHEAINCYLKAIEIYTDGGRFIMAAKNHQNIAETYENDLFDLERAIEHYKQASDYFKCEDNNWSASRCLIKVAQYAAQFESYQDAIHIFEELALLCLHSSLLKTSAKDYLFCACLCHLCVDILNTHHALEHYLQMYPAFQDSREYKFLETLMEYLEEQNSDAFTNAVQKYDSVLRLDQWYTTILLRIKNKISENIDLR